MDFYVVLEQLEENRVSVEGVQVGPVYKDITNSCFAVKGVDDHAKVENSA